MKFRLIVGNQTYMHGHRYYRFLLVFLLGSISIGRYGKGFCKTSIHYLTDYELFVFRNRTPKPPLALASP